MKDTLRGLLLAAVLFGLFFVITIVLYNIFAAGKSVSEGILIAFLMGIAYDRTLGWFVRRGRRPVGS